MCFSHWGRLAGKLVDRGHDCQHGLHRVFIGPANQVYEAGLLIAESRGFTAVFEGRLSSGGCELSRVAEKDVLVERGACAQGKPVHLELRRALDSAVCQRRRLERLARYLVQVNRKNVVPA